MMAWFKTKQTPNSVVGAESKESFRIALFS